MLYDKFIEQHLSLEEIDKLSAEVEQVLSCDDNGIYDDEGYELISFR